MKKLLTSFIDDSEISSLKDFLFNLERGPNPIILHNDILLSFQKYLLDNPKAGPMSHAGRFLDRVQEVLHFDNHLIMVYRHRRASCRFYQLQKDEVELEQLPTKQFLTIKEHLVRPELPDKNNTLEINLAPFYEYGPNLKDPDTIGHGIKHLNRYMYTRLAQRPEKWLQTLYEFLKLHQMHGEQLLIDGSIISNTTDLESAIEDAVDFLDRCKYPDDLQRIKNKLEGLGFLDGWGNNAARIMETIHLLQDTIEQPNEETLEEFLSRIPMVSKVALISPHGWFGQKNVLGRPDTGGQVVYILDQARALERYLAKDMMLSGINIEPKILIITRLIPENEGTTSDQRLEKVDNTKNVSILRVPFRETDDRIVPHWISRFKIWPYLDRFTEDVKNELLAELDGRPDLLVGNYTDGNLVATGLSKSLGVVQCNVAHALEKPKYLFSDLYWENFEDKYNFSCQFMADIISMNLANFIITSSRQEITGTDNTIGQYESYQFFTMPGLMKVTNGIDLFHPRFNVIPPGVNNEVFFPYHEKKLRNKKLSKEMTRLLFEIEDENCYGRLDDPARVPIFSIARLDRIKNLTGFVDAFAKNQALRKNANVIIIASLLNPEHSKDLEEADEIRRMHSLIDQHGLHGQIRWIGKFLDKEETGEVYRIIADRQGVFVQPAMFEAFGLTILEAMHSGLPVFATEFGGPREIIENNKSGFLINPTAGGQMTTQILDFIVACRDNPEHWINFSEESIKRAQDHFTWELYCQRLTRLTKVYGFWKYSISSKAKMPLIHYCQLLYKLFFLTRSEKLR